MARHFALPQFWESYHALPAEVQDLADKSFKLLNSTPQHPALRFRRVGKVFSARVGLHYRALAVHRDDDYYWFWIGSHADYDALIRSV